MSDMTIKRDDDEVTGFEDPMAEGIPSWAVQNGNSAAIVTGRHGYEFDSPIWLHPQTAFEMDEAGLVEIIPEYQVSHGDVTTIYLYRSA